MSTGACLVPVMDNTVASGRLYTSKMCSALSSRDFLNCRKSLNGTRRHSSTEVRLNGHLPANNSMHVGNSLQPPLRDHMLHTLRRDVDALDGRTKSLACELSKIRQTMNSFVDADSVFVCEGEPRNRLKEVSDKIKSETGHWSAHLAREACERRQLELFFRKEMQKLCDLAASHNADLAPSDSRERVEKDTSAGRAVHKGIPAALSEEKLSKDINFIHDLKKEYLLGMVNALKEDIKVIKVDAQHTANEIVALKGGVENLSTTLKSDLSDEVTVLKRDINLIKADAEDRANELVALKGSAESLLALKSHLKAEKKERIDEVLGLKEDINLMKVDARERASEIFALKRSAEILSATAALKSELEAEKAERMDKAAELRAENISEKKMKAQEIAVLRDDLDEERQKILALNESNLVWLREADSRRKHSEELDRVICTLSGDLKLECQARAHDNVALQRDLVVSQNTFMQQVEELANSITEEASSRKMLSKELADAKHDIELLKTDNATETTARDGEIVTEGSCASSAGGNLDMESVVSALSGNLDSESQARVHDNGALQEKGIHESPPTQVTGVEQERDAFQVVARQCLAEQLLDNAGLQQTNAGLVDVDALVKAQETFLSRVEELSNSIDSASKARTVLSEDLAKSQKAHVSQMEELSNSIGCEAKARETLSNDLVTLQMTLASEVVELSNSVDREVKARDLLLKGLETSQEVLASRVRELSNTVNCELEARITLTKNLATCLERLGELSNRVDCELHTRTILSKNLPPIDEDTSIDSESVQEVLMSRVDDMASTQETLTLQVKELLNTVDSETKARAGLSEDVGRGFDRILKLVQTLQSPGNCEAYSMPFSLSSFAQRVTTNSESSFEVEIGQERGVLSVQ